MCPGPAVSQELSRLRSQVLNINIKGPQRAHKKEPVCTCSVVNKHFLSSREQTHSKTCEELCYISEVSLCPLSSGSVKKEKAKNKNPQTPNGNTQLKAPSHSTKT